MQNLNFKFQNEVEFLVKFTFFILQFTFFNEFSMTDTSPASYENPPLPPFGKGGLGGFRVFPDKLEKKDCTKLP